MRIFGNGCRKPESIARSHDCIPMMRTEATLLIAVADPTQELLALLKQETGLDVSAHARNFFDCVKSRGLPAANSQVMRRSHIACHAAALSWLLNRKLRLDPAKEEFIGDDEANGLRSLPSRKVL